MVDALGLDPGGETRRDSSPLIRIILAYNAEKTC